VAAAASALRLSAPDLLRLGIADEIVPEPPGGAHRNAAAAATEVGKAIGRHLTRLLKLDASALRAARDRKFAAMGSAFVLASGDGHRERGRVEKKGRIG
jgi:acetyl-CoA carboxylase carboxyl transferase subunit alpha